MVTETLEWLAYGVECHAEMMNGRDDQVLPVHRVEIDRAATGDHVYADLDAWNEIVTAIVIADRDDAPLAAFVRPVGRGEQGFWDIKVGPHLGRLCHNYDLSGFQVPDGLDRCQQAMDEIVKNQQIGPVRASQMDIARIACQFQHKQAEAA